MASGDNEINVKVTATTDGLVSGLSKATGEVKDFGSEINGLAQRMAAIKPDAFKALAQEFNNGKVDLDEFRDGLIAMSTASSAASTTLSAASTEAVALAGSSHLSAGGMRELVVVGRELASGNFTRLPGSLSILATRLGGIPPQAILATAAIAAVGYALYEIIDSSQQADAALEKIQNAFSAVGAGDQFNRSQIQQYVADLRQIPGVTADIANAAVNDFARVKNGTKVLGEATGDIRPLSELLGIEVPQAAHLLAEALEDPVKGIQSLQKYGVELTASQQDEIRQMMAVNDVAGAQRVLLDGLGASMSGLADTTTGFERFWTDLGNSFSGVSEKAAQTRLQLEALARTASDPSIAQAARIWAGVEGVKSRNVPGTSWSGSSGTVAGGDEKQAAQDKAAQTRRDNEEIAVTNKMYETGNSALREQEGA